MSAPGNDIEDSPVVLDHRLKGLEQQIANLRNAKRDSERKCFEATQRGQQLASELGFGNIEEAEENISLYPQLYNRATIEYNSTRVALLKQQLNRLQELRKGDFNKNQELSRVIASLRQENEELRTRPVNPSDRRIHHVDLCESFQADSSHIRVHASVQTSVENSLIAERLVDTQEELSELQKRYDSLLKAKERATKDLVNSIKRHDRLSKWAQKQKAHKKMKDRMRKSADPPFHTSQSRFSSPSDLNNSPAPFNSSTDPGLAPVVSLDVPSQASQNSQPLSRNILNEQRLSTPRESPSEASQSQPSSLKRKYESGDSEDLSQTEDDSQAPSIYVPSTPRTPRTVKTLPRVGEVRPRVVIPTAHNIDQPHPVKDERFPPTPHSTALKRSKQIDRPSIEEDAAQDVVSSSVERPSKTINAQYEINPDVNEKLDYQFDEVVRGRQARQRLHGTDCDCCRDYYEAVGPLPPRLSAPMWRTPSPSPARPAERQDAIDSHKQEISRHRQQWQRNNTPPDFWIIGFPDTQAASRINVQAEQMHKDKMEMVEREARKQGGMYRKRG